MPEVGNPQNVGKNIVELATSILEILFGIFFLGGTAV